MSPRGPSWKLAEGLHCDTARRGLRRHISACAPGREASHERGMCRPQQETSGWGGPLGPAGPAPAPLAPAPAAGGARAVPARGGAPAPEPDEGRGPGSPWAAPDGSLVLSFWGKWAAAFSRGVLGCVEVPTLWAGKEPHGILRGLGRASWGGLRMDSSVYAKCSPSAPPFHPVLCWTLGATEAAPASRCPVAVGTARPGSVAREGLLLQTTPRPPLTDQKLRVRGWGD